MTDYTFEITVSATADNDDVAMAINEALLEVLPELNAVASAAGADSVGAGLHTITNEDDEYTLVDV